MSRKNEVYVYESLQGGPIDTIRLVTLEPGTMADKIKCVLSPVCLSEQPHYYALSYVWGTAAASRDATIIVNNRTLSIMSNLHSFLKYLRHTAVAIRIWADAICINQEDVSERGHQVGLMGEIYRNAKVVYSWLGEDERDIHKLWRLNYQWSHIFHRDGHLKQKPPLLCSLDTQLPQLTEASALRLVRRPDSWTALANICENPYWTRVWIVQEVLLARSNVLCFGHRRIKWEDFNLLARQLEHVDHLRPWWTFQRWFGTRYIQSDKLDESRRRIFTCNGIMEFLKRKTQYQFGEERRALEDLLTDYKTQSCLDPRDRIYAMLALADDAGHIRADYSKSRWDLYRDVAPLLCNQWYLGEMLELPLDEVAYLHEMFGSELGPREGGTYYNGTGQKHKVFARYGINNNLT